jgi:branched-chain amino acid transport system ATP-binding protein
VASGPAGGNAITTTDTVLAVVVVVGLLARRSVRRRADRADTSSWQASVDPAPVPVVLARLPVVRVGRVVAALVALAAALALPLLLTPSQEFRASVVGALAILALSVVVLTGWTGEVTLGQMAFAAVGGAITALATVEWRLDLSLTLLVAGSATAVVAVVLGIPSLRWQGLFLAVTTLAFGVAALGWFLNPSEASWIPRDAVFRRPLLGVWDLHGDTAMYYVSLGVLVLCLVAVAGIRQSRVGRVLRALRDNGPGAQAFGVRLPVARLTAFAVSGFLAGVAGAMMVYVNEAYDPATFAAEQGLNVFISSVVGGVGSALGAILGALVLDGSRTFLSGTWALLPSALGVLVVLLVLPGGLAELVYRVRDRILRGVAARRGIELVRPDVALGAAGVDPGSAADGDRGGGQVVTLSAEPPPGTLSVRGLDVAYDRVQVLFGVDLDVRPGEITALLGTNGAGKSTLLRAIGGVAPITAGTVRLDDVDLRALDPDQVAGAGIAQMPGGAGVFPSLTVDENLRVAAWGIRHEGQRVRDRTAEVRSRFPVLESRAGDQAGDLSGGQQQQLALAMALLGEPSLLLIDELSLGLAPVIVEQLLGELRALRDRGTTIVIVEQSVNVALGIADHAYFMEKGAIRFAGPAQELLQQPELVKAIYLQGAREALAGDDGSSRPARVVVGSPRVGGNGSSAAAGNGAAHALETRGLSVQFGGIAAVDAVDLVVRPGEVVGLIGPNGAGKTTLFDLVCGFTAAHSGRVLLHGADVADRPPSARARAGIGRSFQDARLFPGLTVAETIATALERWIQVGDPVSGALRLPASQLTEAAVAERVDELMELFGLTHLRQTRIGELSTGSRRMVDLACVIGHRPSVLLLDEPTSGIAQREAEALGPVLLGLRDRLEASLLVIEHDIGLIASISDRLVALDSGAVVAAGPPAEVLDHPAVVASYLGSGDATLQRSDQPARGHR